MSIHYTVMKPNTNIKHDNISFQINVHFLSAQTNETPLSLNKLLLRLVLCLFISIHGEQTALKTDKA